MDSKFWLHNLLNLIEVLYYFSKVKCLVLHTVILILGEKMKREDKFEKKISHKNKNQSLKGEMAA